MADRRINITSASLKPDWISTLAFHFEVLSITGLENDSDFASLSPPGPLAIPPRQVTFLHPLRYAKLGCRRFHAQATSHHRSPPAFHGRALRTYGDATHNVESRN